MAPSADPSSAEHLPAPIAHHQSSDLRDAMAGPPDAVDLGAQPDALNSRASFEALVDAVIERIERRVIDELERRGRAQTWSGF